MLWAFAVAKLRNGLHKFVMTDEAQSLVAAIRRQEGKTFKALAEATGLGQTRLREIMLNEASGRVRLFDLALVAESLGYRLEYCFKKSAAPGGMPLVFNRQVDRDTLIPRPKTRSAPLQVHRSTAMVRKSAGFENEIARFEPQGCFAVLFGRELHLTPTSYLMLAALARAYPQPVTAEQLLLAGWGEVAPVKPAHLSSMLGVTRARLRAQSSGIDIVGTRKSLYFLVPPEGWAAGPLS